MAEYIDIAQLWNCETCFHHQNGKCSPSVWCDHGESYRPAYDKLKKADVVEVVHGRWEQFECGWRDDYWRCSVCDFEFTTLDGEHPQENGVNYCPNCGCRMDGGNE